MRETITIRGERGEEVLCRRVAKHEYFGMDSRGDAYVVYDDPSAAVEAQNAALRKQSHGNVRKVCSPDMTWKLKARLPASVAAALGPKIEDPDFMEHLLRKRPEYGVYDEGSTRSKRMGGLPKKEAGDNG